MTDNFKTILIQCSFILLAVLSLILFTKVNEDIYRIFILIVVFVCIRLSSDVGKPFPKKVLLKDFVISFSLFTLFLILFFFTEMPFHYLVLSVFVALSIYSYWMKKYYKSVVKQISLKALETRTKEDLELAMKLLTSSKQLSKITDENGEFLLGRIESYYNR